LRIVSRLTAPWEFETSVNTYSVFSGVTRGLSQRENLAERGSLAATVGPLANTQKKLRNDNESRCGCLYWNPT